MRYLAWVAVLLAVAFPAAAHNAYYIGSLSGSAEASPNASAGSGLVILTVNDDDVTMRVQVAFSGLSGSVTAANVYCCTAAEASGTAAVVTGPATLAGFPLGVTSGIYDQMFDMSLASSYDPLFVSAHGATPDTAFDALLTGLIAGRAYLNIITTSFGGGEVRVFPENTVADLPPFPAVPEASSAWLMALGLGTLAAAVGRRQRHQRHQRRH